MNWLKTLVLLLLLLVPSFASIGLTYNSTTKIYDMWNDYHHFYINSTSGFQFSNVPGEWWSRNYWCVQWDGSGWVCSDSLSWTWTNITNSSTAILNGTATVSGGGKTANVVISYMVNTTEPKIQISFFTTMTKGSAVWKARWRTADIRVNNTSGDDSVKVFNNSLLLEYDLNSTSLNKTFTNLSTKMFHMNDKFLEGWMQTWWNNTNNQSYTLYLYRNTADLEFTPGSMGVGSRWNTTLWWEDALCGWGCGIQAPADLNISQGMQFTMSVNRSFWNTCTATGNYLASEISNGTWYNTSATTNLTLVSGANPEYGEVWSDWIIEAGDDNAPTTPFSVRGHCYFNLQHKFTSSRTINVSQAVVKVCTNVSSSTTLTSSQSRCYNIISDNVNFNCNGKTIYGDFTTPGFNITDRTGITIRNCIMENFSTGIWANRVNNSIFYNNTMKYLYKFSPGNFWDVDGYRFWNSKNIIIENATITNVTEDRNGTTSAGGLSRGIDFRYVNTTRVFNITMTNISGSYHSGGGDPLITDWSYGIYLGGVLDANISRITIKNATYGEYISSIYGLVSNISTSHVSVDTALYGLYTTTYSINASFFNVTNSGWSAPTVATGFRLGSSDNNLSNFVVDNVTGYMAYVNGVRNSLSNGVLRNATYYGLWISSADNSSIRNVSIVNVTWYYGVYCYLSEGVWINNITISSANNSMYLFACRNGTISNSTFQSKLLHEFIMNTWAYGNFFLNTSANYGNVSWIGADDRNFTVQWYARINVTSGGSALNSTIEVVSNDSKTAFNSSGYALTPYFIVNDTSHYQASNFSHNNYSIRVSKIAYITNYSLRNFSTKDATINITLYPAPVPVLTYQNPTPPNNANLSQSWVYVNVSSDIALNNMLLNWNGTWYQMSNSSQTVWYLNRTGLSNGTYNYNVSTNSTYFANQNTTTRNVTIDTVNPVLTWIGTTPLNNSVQSSTSAYFNLSGSENLWNCSLSINGLWVEMDFGNRSNAYHQVLGLGDTQYIFFATCNDSAGNNGTSETRNFTVSTVVPGIITTDNNINTPSYMFNRMTVKRGIFLPVQVREWIRWFVRYP